MTNRVREERERRGFGQSELADRAGVTRQSLGAIEANRHSPSVDTAMRIAAALGASVETLFSPGRRNGHSPVGAPSPVGTPVVVGRVGDQRVHAPVRRLLNSSESWAFVDGFVNEDGVDLIAGTDESGFVVAGCDPLLGLATAVLTHQRGPRVVPVHLSTGAAIDALSRRVVHGIVVHGPRASLPKPPVGVRKWRFASWQVGVASSPGNAVSSIEQLADRRLRTAQREEGAGTQRAFQRALAAVGASSVPGPRVDSHVDAARHVVAGLRAGITMEAAAAAFDLTFLPLETHHSELWIDATYVDHRGAEALIGVLSDPALVARAGRLPGYDVARMGSELRAS